MLIIKPLQHHRQNKRHTKNPTNVSHFLTMKWMQWLCTRRHPWRTFCNWTEWMSGKLLSQSESILWVRESWSSGFRHSLLRQVILPTTPRLWSRFLLNKEQSQNLSSCKFNPASADRKNNTVKSKYWAEFQGFFSHKWSCRRRQVCGGNFR